MMSLQILRLRQQQSHRMAEGEAGVSRYRTAITILPLTTLINRRDQGSTIGWPTEVEGVRRRCPRCRPGCSRRPGPSGCSMTFTQPLRPSMTQASYSTRSNRRHRSTSSSGWLKHPLTEPRSELFILSSVLSLFLL